MRDAAEDEATVGMEVFLTDTPGIGGRLRATAEDFVVIEQSKPPPRQQGPYCVATITSTNWETNHLVESLSSQLRISRNAIAFAGTKDKRAITTQLMSFRAPVESVQAIALRDVTISDVYPVANPLHLGALLGNTFRLTVSGVTLAPRRRLEGVLADTLEQLRDNDGAPNFFGIQRFGALRPCTHLVGRKLTEGDIEGAVMTYLGSPSQREEDSLREVRTRLSQDHDFAAALEAMPQALRFERAMLHHLHTHAGDFRGALEQLPRNLTLMFIHAYQSYLFNRILSARIRSGLPLNDAVIGDLVLTADRNGAPRPADVVKVTAANVGATARQVKAGRAFVSHAVFGMQTPLSEGDPGELERKVLDEEKVQASDFSIHAIPRLTTKGVRREVLASPFPMKVEVDLQDESRVDLNFRLGRGCYATSVAREFLKADTLSY